MPGRRLEPRQKYSEVTRSPRSLSHALVTAVTTDRFLLRAALQHRHCRQLLALEELEERAAARGDVADALGDAELVDRGERVAAAGERERLAPGDRVRERLGAAGECIVLEHADRTVPDDRARIRELRYELRPRLRPDVEDHLVFMDFGDG